MGRTGTAAAKEAADIVLGDDNFPTIQAAIEEGRRVDDTSSRALAFALPTNVGEALVALFLLDTSPDTAAGSPELAQAHTLAVTSVAFFQIFYLLTCRTAPVRTVAGRATGISPESRCSWSCRSGSSTCPSCRRCSAPTPWHLGDWLLAAGTGALVVPVIAPLEKAWRRRADRRRRDAR
jgi:hypothetical protein